MKGQPYSPTLVGCKLYPFRRSFKHQNQLHDCDDRHHHYHDNPHPHPDDHSPHSTIIPILILIAQVQKIPVSSPRASLSHTRASTRLHSDRLKRRLCPDHDGGGYGGGGDDHGVG